MRATALLAALTLAFATSVAVEAQGRGNGQAKKAAAPAKSAATPAKTTKTAAKPAAPKAAKGAAKVDNRAAKATAKADTRTAKSAAKADARATKADTKLAKKTPAAVVGPTATDVTPATPTTTRVKNAKLESRLAVLLPAGTNMQEAAAGFKNWGQFVAAVHVSNNLGIPFADLKSAMTGIPVGTPAGTPVVPTTAPLSLGQAIQSLKNTTTATTPTTDETLTWSQIGREVKKAEDAATDDLRRTRERS